MAIEIKEPTVLVVEGKEEVFFFEAFIKHLGIRNIQIVDMEGKTNLRARLKALIDSPGFRRIVVSLGLVRDANAQPASTLHSVQDTLRALGLPVPDRPLTTAGIKPRVTVLILPDEKTPGMLEDVCLKSVIKDLAMFCVEQYFKCLQEQGIPLPHNESKARIQVFLASKPEAGKRLGEAAQAGYWPWEDNSFEQIKEFLQQIVL
jgi:hypothetical protein